MENTHIGFFISCTHKEIVRWLENRPTRKENPAVNGYYLAYLYHNKDNCIYQKDFEKALAITKGTASKVLDNLENKNIIKRIPDVNDKRLNRIVLTDDGVNLHKMYKKDIDELDNLIESQFSKEELESINEYLQRIKKVLKVGD